MDESLQLQPSSDNREGPRAIAQSREMSQTLTAVRDAAVPDHSICRPITSIRLAAFVNMSCSATAGSKGEHR